jgi:hypothetical protein
VLRAKRLAAPLDARGMAVGSFKRVTHPTFR